MPHESWIGTWRLAAWSQIEAQAMLLGEDTNPESISAWLNGFGEPDSADAKPASGLLLTIGPDGAFTERVTGAPGVAWFDEEGVLANTVTPFDGTVTAAGGTGYLRPARIASWAIPVDNRYGQAILRYDDGDTKIADGVRRAGERLVRTVNVVTDELYLTRVLLFYAQAHAG